MNRTPRNSCNESHPSEKKTWLFILLLNVHVIVVIAALIGSYLVLRAFHKFHNLRTASNIILVSLSTADGLLAIPSIVDTIYLSLKLSGKHRFCSTFKEVSATSTFFLVSVIILHLTLMSAESFIAIKFALRYHTIVTNRRAQIVSMLMWLWALVVMIAFPQALRAVSGDSRKFYKAINPYSNTCERFWGRGPRDGGRRNEGLWMRGHLVFTAVSMFLVPLLIILCSYGYIFNVSYKHRKRVREQADIPGMAIVKREMKGAYTLAIVVALCLLSIIPLLAVTSLRVFGVKLRFATFHITYDMAMFLNAISNPLIYGWRNEEFRKAFRKMLKCSSSEPSA